MKTRMERVAVRPNRSHTLERVDEAAAGFNRADLMVAIAITCLVIMALSPGLARTRVNDRGFICLNNMRQLTVAWSMYAEDHQGMLVNSFSWLDGWINYDPSNSDNTNVQFLLTGPLGPYVKNPALFKCPEDQSVGRFSTTVYPRVRSTSMSQMFRYWPGGHSPSPPWAIYRKNSDLLNPIPAKLWLFIDENPDSVEDAAFAVRMGVSAWQSGPSMLHNGGCAFSFTDGHGELKQWLDWRTLAMKPTYKTRFQYGWTQPNNPDIQWVQDRTTALE